MNVSPSGLELVKFFESCLEPDGKGMFKAYADPAHGWKVPTIGWGTIAYPSGKKVKKGDRITQAQADMYLVFEVKEKSAGVDALVKTNLFQREFDALVSFSYNVGLANLKKSTLLKKLNAGDKSGAADEFLKWDKAGGKVLRGLTRRRKAERAMFLGE